MKMIGRAGIAVLVALLGTPCVADTDDPHRYHKAMMSKSSVQQETGAQYTIPHLAMIDQRGQEVVVTDLLDTDKPVLVNFIFTTCTTICPAMASIFQQVQMGLGEDAEDILMVSVSIDPEYDSVDALADYASRFRAGPQWHFLTGTLENSIAIQQAFDAYRGDKMNHAPMTLLRTGDDTWMRFEGFATTSRLEDECRKLLQQREENS